MPATLAYETSALHIHEDADGTLHIEIPPMGAARAVRLYPLPQFVLGTFFAAVGMAAPVTFLYYYSQTHQDLKAMLYVVPCMYVLMGGFFYALIRYRAQARAYIRATPTQFSIEAHGLGEPKRISLSRDEIEFLDARPIASDEPHQIVLCVRRKRYDTNDHFLGQLPAAEIRRIASLLQQKLNLQPATSPKLK